MGDIDDRAISGPEAIERRLPRGAVLRGFRWGAGPDVALLLHEPGVDIDAWGPLPFEIARQLEIEAVAVDLPGHGLSDGPWDPDRLPDLLRNLPDIAPAAGYRFLIAAGDSAMAALDQEPTLELSGLVCLSPRIPSDAWRPPRSPRVPKLLLAGAMAGNDLHDSRRLATVCGGWAVVTSYPVTERGTQLLASPWGRHLIEEIGGFLRDCQPRPAQTSLQTDRTRPGTPSAPRGCQQFPVSERPGTSGGAPSEPGR